MRADERGGRRDEANLLEDAQLLKAAEVDDVAQLRIGAHVGDERGLVEQRARAFPQHTDDARRRRGRGGGARRPLCAKRVG